MRGDGQGELELDAAVLAEMVDAMSAMLMPSAGGRLGLALPVLTVGPDGVGWQVTRFDGGLPRAVGRSRTRKEAAACGRRLARAAGGTLVLRRANGSVQQTFHYAGGAPMRAGSVVKLFEA